MQQRKAYTINDYPEYISHVYIEGGCSGFEAIIQADQDLDSEFLAWDVGNQEWVKVSGWNCDISEL